MPSPFPGMDPFIEGQVWEEFHDLFLGEIHAALVPSLRPRYVVRMERRVYVVRPEEAAPAVIRPDLTVVRPHSPRPRPEEAGGGTAVAVAVASPTVPVPLAMPRREEELYLEIRLRETGEVITVIELLSPNNKRRGSDGQREYQEKRDAVLLSGTHLLEMDLLRGGERLPTTRPLPPAEHYVILSRAGRRPLADVYPVRLREPLPRVRVPLAGEDEDVILDLQAVFAAVYDRAGYDYSLDYFRDPEPPLPPEDLAWTREVLAGRETA